MGKTEVKSKLFAGACACLWGPYYVSEAAREMGVGRRTIQRYFNGERDIPRDVVERLVELLKERQAKIEKLLQQVQRGS